MTRRHMKWNSMTLIVVLLNALLGASAAVAADFEYPELNMVPRNSERLEQEAAKENVGRNLANVLPMHAAGAGSLMAGILNYNGADPTVGIVAISAGSATILGTTLFALFYSPYKDGVAELPAKGSSLRDRLQRERMAELYIDRAAGNINRLRWFVSVVNFGVSIAAGASAVSRGMSTAGPAPFFLSGAAGLSIGVAGALVAIAPLIFKPYWISVAHEQDDFRKRNFAPVAGVGLTPVGSSFEPTLQLAWKF